MRKAEFDRDAIAQQRRCACVVSVSRSSTNRGAVSLVYVARVLHRVLLRRLLPPCSALSASAESSRSCLRCSSRRPVRSIAVTAPHSLPLCLRADDSHTDTHHAGTTHCDRHPTASDGSQHDGGQIDRRACNERSRTQDR